MLTLEMTVGTLHTVDAGFSLMVADSVRCPTTAAFPLTARFAQRDDRRQGSQLFGNHMIASIAVADLSVPTGAAYIHHPVAAEVDRRSFVGHGKTPVLTSLGSTRPASSANRSME